MTLCFHCVPPKHLLLHVVCCQDFSPVHKIQNPLLLMILNDWFNMAMLQCCGKEKIIPNQKFYVRSETYPCIYES